MNRQILFVDDETSVLDGIRRALRDPRGQWDMHFASSGREALTLMQGQPMDAIVTDMKMPGMDGAALLLEVSRLYPGVVRMVLSGHSDQEFCLRSAGLIHQFLAKPADPQEVKDVLRRAFMIRTVLNDDLLVRVVTQVTALPAVPVLYRQIEQELRQSNASVEKVGRLVADDVAISARILQVANSALFGLAHRVASPTQAAALLGLESLKTLVLLSHVFGEHAGVDCPGFSLDMLWQHSLSISARAMLAVQAEGGSGQDREVACTGGLLHDIGKLVLAVNFKESYAAAMKLGGEKGLSDAEAERGTFGVSHAEVGGYLLALWGLPDRVVEAVSLHHCPASSLTARFGPLSVIHAAHLMSSDRTTLGGVSGEAPVDMEYLKAIDKEHRVPVWMELWRNAEKRQGAL